MALENARKFLLLVQEDQALQDRLAGMTPEDRSNVAREMGLDYTEEELMDALKTVDVSPDELKQVSGGGRSYLSHLFEKEPKWLYGSCLKSSDGNHNWIKQGHREDPHTFLFWDYTDGYDEYICTYCGEHMDVHT